MYKPAADILASPVLGDIWERAHVTKKEENPYQELADQVHDITDNIEEHPKLLVFMHRLVGLELGALGKPKNSDTVEDTKLRHNLDNIYTHIGTLCKQNNISLTKTKLPEDQQHLLDIIENHTGQKSFTPFKSLTKITKNLAVDIYDEAREHPFMFTGFCAMALGVVNMSRQSAGKFSTLSVDPALTTITNLDMDMLLSDDMDDLKFDESYLNTDLVMGCHDTAIELAGMVAGEPGANLMRDHAPDWIVSLSPDHCSKVQDLASKTQNGTQWFFDKIHERLDAIIKDPTTAIGDTMNFGEQFQASFYQATQATSDFIYAFNDWENITIHTILAVMSARAVIKLKDWNTPEHKETRDNIKDFWHRNSIANKPLPYVLAASGSTYAYMATNGATPETLWSGISGLVAGGIAHKIHNKIKSKDFVHDTTISISKSNAQSADPSLIVSEQIAGEDLPKNSYKYKTWKDYAKTTATTVGATTILTTIDAIATNGQITGSLLGGAIPTAIYLGYNVPEDAVLHVPFMLGGGALGAVTLPFVIGIEMAKDSLVNLVKGNNNDGDDHTNDPS